MGIGLYDYEELARTGGKITPKFQKKLHEKLRVVWEKAVAAGTEDPIRLKFFDAESAGSHCPICGDAPVRMEKERFFFGKSIGMETTFRFDCNCEENHIYQKKVKADLKKRTAECRIPEKYSSSSWEDWDTRAHQDLTDSFYKVRWYSTDQGLERLTERMGLCLYGENGRGKTMAGVCLLKSLLENTRLRCRFVPMADYISLIFRSGGTQREESSFEKDLEQFDVLYLDDLDKLSTQSEWVQERAFSLFDRMYRNRKTVIFSTNLLKIGEIENFFRGPGSAIVSRMIEGMDFIKFTAGEDYRFLGVKK